MRLSDIVYRLLAGLFVLSVVYMGYSLVLFFGNYSLQRFGITLLILGLAFVIGTWFLANELGDPFDDTDQTT